jgi:hypothetical protein
MSRSQIVAVVVAACAAAQAAPAQIAVHHDRVAWRTAAQAPTNLDENFSGFGAAITDILGTPIPLADGAMSVHRVWTPGPAPSGVARIINFGPPTIFDGNYAEFTLIADGAPSLESASAVFTFDQPLRAFGFDAQYSSASLRSLVRWNVYNDSTLLGSFQLPEGQAFSGFVAGALPATRLEVVAVRPSGFHSPQATFRMDNAEGLQVPGPGVAWLATFFGACSLARRRRRTNAARTPHLAAM